MERTEQDKVHLPLHDRVSLCHPGWMECNGIISAHCHLYLRGSSDHPTSGAHNHTWLIFVFFVELGSYNVAQAGLKLLGASSPLALASQSARYHTQLTSVFLIETGFHHVGQAGLNS
ncbi:Zinc finger protein [Plecturocebus cupreus]